MQLQAHNEDSMRSKESLQNFHSQNRLGHKDIRAIGFQSVEIEFKVEAESLIESVSRCKQKIGWHKQNIFGV